MAILDVAISGINAAQLGLQTTANNISNASTPGYSRQQIEQSTNTPLFTGSGFIGQGTEVSTIQRIYNSFLSTQLLATQANASSLSTYNTQISQIDNLLGDPTKGLSAAMQNFFTAVGSAAADPSSTSARQTMLSGAQGLVDQFKTLNQQLSDMATAINQQIVSEADTINADVQQLASVNQNIITAQSAGSSQPANDLLDQRDQIVSNLSKEVQVTTQPQADGTVNVFFGNGQPLLIGGAVTKLVTQPAPQDSSRTEVAIQDANGKTTTLPESLVTGGNLGGLLQFRSQSLDQAQIGLGQIATVFARSVDAQQQLGQDLNGALGTALFNTTQTSDMTVANSGNIGDAKLSVTINNSANLAASDYQLVMTGTNTLTLTRLSDNKTWTGSGSSQSSAMTDLTNQLSSEGFSLSFASGTMNVGDSFLVQPVRYGARDIAVALSDPAKLALAAPISTAAGAANAGTATVTAGTVSSVSTTLASPFSIRYESSSTSFTGFPVGSTVDVGGTTYQITSPTMRVPYTAGANISVDGVGVKISGTPADGDSFVIAPNGDSSVANTAIASVFGTVTAAAGTSSTAGTATGSLDVSGGVTITAGSNDSFSVAIDGGTPALVTIPAGTYTSSQLATQLQTSINDAVAPASVTVTINGSNQVVVTSGTTGTSSSVTLGSANTGSGTIAAGSVTSTDSLPAVPITLTYSKANDALSGFPVGAVVDVNGTKTTITSATKTVSYTSGATISFNGISFAISGTPADGDSFTVGPNTSGSSDNRNAVLIGNLQTTKTMSQSTATYQDSYAQLVAQVGNQAREVSVASTAQNSLLQQGQNAVQSVSGVNLDEEAANLMRYQQAYQASAKIITIVGKLFDTLLQL